jgi:enterochelin esterase-like enzyme
VLEPQGTLFFLLLIVAFAGLMVWLALARQVVFRILAAILAFIPAMVFGIAAVNKYYDYYQTWGALFSDLSGQSGSVKQLALGDGKYKSIGAELAATTDPVLDAQDGYLFRTDVTGPRSHITRDVYVYLPPQYFLKAYAKYKFPAIELLHGSPGEPQDWVNVLNVIPTYLKLLAEHKAQPAVLVMPNTDGGRQYALQCLNAPGGLQDMTYIGEEVPDWVTANLRVLPPSVMWGIAGFSEGGFCAANIALNYPKRFGFAAALSGYFAPTDSQVPSGWKPGSRPVDINVFKHHPALALKNTPQEYIQHIPTDVSVPQFWLAAGAEDAGDVQAATYFRQLLLTRVAQVPLMIVPGGGHQALVWRAAEGPMLSWMTDNLATDIREFPKVELAPQRRPTIVSHRDAPHQPVAR